MTSVVNQDAGPRAAAAPKVFLSHSSADHDFVESIRAPIEAGGYPCWVAYRDVAKGGEEIYAGQIMAAIEECPTSSWSSHRPPSTRPMSCARWNVRSPSGAGSSRSGASRSSWRGAGSICSAPCSGSTPSIARRATSRKSCSPP